MLNPNNKHERISGASDWATNAVSWTGYGEIGIGKISEICHFVT